MRRAAQSAFGESFVLTQSMKRRESKCEASETRLGESAWMSSRLQPGCSSEMFLTPGASRQPTHSWPLLSGAGSTSRKAVVDAPSKVWFSRRTLEAGKEMVAFVAPTQ